MCARFVPEMSIRTCKRRVLRDRESLVIRVLLVLFFFSPIPVSRT